MANMFQKVSAISIEEYLNAIPEDRKKILVFLHDFIRKTVPSLAPYFSDNMPGYGKFKYKNYKKEEIDWPVIALANQKNYISLYVCAVENGEYIAEKYKKDLGKVNVGRSCIRFNKLEDVNLNTLKLVLQKAAASPGLPVTVKSGR